MRRQYVEPDPQVRRAVAPGHQSGRAFRSERGFTLTEMMIATAIMLTITGAVFSLLDPAQGTFKAQPEVADMQQRLRVAVDTVRRDLVMAGAGAYSGINAGALSNFFAPVMPYRVGDSNDDPKAGVFYRTNAISIVYVPPTPSQTTIRDAMPKTARELKVNAQENCPDRKHDQLCGFGKIVPARVIIFDDSGSWDPITITKTQDEALHLQYDGDLSKSYDIGSTITQVATHTYYLKEDNTTKTYQLMHYDGWNTDLPIVDNVVKLEFEYFGEPQPPRLIPNKSLAAGSLGPWTTYGPKPPALGVNNANDTWPAGENCVFSVVDGQHQPRLSVLATGTGQVKLSAGILRDGPWCGDETQPRRFDADLLRIRRVRAKLRVQVAAPSLRGPAGLFFKYGGTAPDSTRYVPDQEVSFDVAPRNMNLGR